MEKTKIVLFNKGNVENLLKQFDFTFSTNEEEGTMILDKNKDIVKCDTCEETLITERVGNIAHGSRKLFCDNPLCFATWVAKNKIK